LFLLLAAAQAAAGPVHSDAQLGQVTARFEIDNDTVKLSGQLALQLTVEGPKRVEVVLPQAPEEVLTAESRQLWKIKRIGEPQLEDLGGERQRWRQEFLLYPYKEGPNVPIALETLKVRAGALQELNIPWKQEPPTIAVTTTAQADPQSLRPITSVEAPSPSPAPVGPRQHWLIVTIVAIGAVLTLLAVAVLARRAPARPAIVHDAAWTLHELGALSDQRAERHQPPGGAAATFARLAETLRLFLQDWRGVPATRLTTHELHDALSAANQVAAADAVEIQSILERCDLQKFAQSAPDSAGLNDAPAWIERAMQWVAKVASLAPRDEQNTSH
jgi:hypothetical protein